VTGLPLAADHGGGRFPDFDSTAEADHWDDTTSAVVMGRLGRPADVRFLSVSEEAAARALFDQLLDQHEEPRVPVVHLVDARLADKQTDGWHFEGMPPDADAWRITLAALDDDSRERCGTTFAEASRDQQAELLQAIADLGGRPWQDLPADQVWGLWTRYACVAFYSHPWAWDEIGFAGPAYPRGYKNIGIDAREPFEVADADPGRHHRARADR
jgi:hypothetical protein